MAWTEEMVEELKRLWDEGVTTGEIGRRLNISKNSIVGKVHRLGLSGRPSPIKKKSDSAATPASPKSESEKKAKTPKSNAAKPAKQPKPEKPQAIKKAEAPKKQEKPSTPATPSVAKPISKESAIKKLEKEPIISANEEEDIKLAKSINILSNSDSKKEYLDLIDLDNHTCRWPIGDPKDENFHFCGRKVKIGQTYCEEHSLVAYVKPNKK